MSQKLIAIFVISPNCIGGGYSGRVCIAPVALAGNRKPLAKVFVCPVHMTLCCRFSVGFV